MIYPVILCGGSGSRLWPLSRSAYPKQFLDLTGALKLWVNPKTDLPVKIECLVRGGGAITFDEFKWNETIDEALFDLDVPKGYREGTLPTGIPQETKK